MIGLCISNLTIIFTIILHTYSIFSFVHCQKTETPIPMNCLKSSSITLIPEIILLFLPLLFFFTIAQCFFTLYIHFYYHVLKVVLVLSN